MEVGGSISGSIDGGGGSDELIGPDQLNDWLVDRRRRRGPQRHHRTSSTSRASRAARATTSSGSPPPVGAGSSTAASTCRLDQHPARRHAQLRTLVDAPSRSTSALATGHRRRRVRPHRRRRRRRRHRRHLVGPGHVRRARHLADHRRRRGRGRRRSCPATRTSRRRCSAASRTCRGRPAASDSFLFGAAGSVSGVVDGGTGPDTVDSLAVSDGTTTAVLTPPTPSGTADAGRRPDLPLRRPGAVHRAHRRRRRASRSPARSSTTRSSSRPTRHARLHEGHVRRHDVLERPRLPHRRRHRLRFENPTTSLTIEAGSGGDTITVKSLDAGFAAELCIYGNKAGRADDRARRRPATRSRFEGNIFTDGGYLEVFADVIKIVDDVIVSTLATTRRPRRPAPTI